MADGGGTVDNDENNAIRFENGRKVGQRWRVLEKLDEGGFGQVYKVEDLKNPGRVAALKVESVDMEGGSAIKLEINVLDHINKKGLTPHLPYYMDAKKHKKYVYMVMDLLGRNLKTVKNMYNDDLMPERDWSRMGLQCLHAIKTMHDRGFVHRDIKPSNFVFGSAADISKSRIIHVLDFGLARAFAFKKHGRWEARKARQHIDFRGTFRYASPNMHRAEDLGRRDDMYSLLYMFVEFHVGLPWQTDKDNDLIEKKKFHSEEKPIFITKKFSPELHPCFPALKKLDYYSRPNYKEMFDGLLAIMKRNNVKMSDRFEFETAEEFQRSTSVSRRCSCEDAGKDMLNDPIRIFGPPANADEAGPTRDDPRNYSSKKANGTATESFKKR